MSEVDERVKNEEDIGRLFWDGDSRDEKWESVYGWGKSGLEKDSSYEGV